MTPNVLWDFWRWAFARSYLRDQRRWGDSQASLWSAITNVSISMSFNLLAVGAAAAWAFRLPARVAHPREIGLAVMVVALGANYLRFARYRDADQLIRKLGASSLDATRHEERRLFGYTLGSFLAPVLILVARLYLD
jgi:hypothetical protein